MTGPIGRIPAAATASPSVWSEVWQLAGYLRDFTWAVPAMLFLGLAAALAETLGVSLAVMFLFSILGATAELSTGTGLFTMAFQWFESVFGTNPTVIAASAACLILVKAFLIYGYHVLTAVLLNHIAQRMRDLVHERFVTVGYSYLQQRDHGQLVHTLGTETWDVSEACYSIARLCVNITAIAVFGTAFLLFSWQIGLAAALCALIGFALMRLLARRVRRFSKVLLAEDQTMYQRMLVALNGMRTLRVFDLENHVRQVFAASSDAVRRVAIRKERTKELIVPLGELVGLGTLCAIALVAYLYQIDTATTIASVVLLIRLQPHLRGLNMHRLELAGHSATLRNMRETLDELDKPWPTEGRLDHAGMEREIRFEDVSFAHDGRLDNSLDGISCRIPVGDVTILEGPSGSGKSTLINLLLRLYEPNAGRITVDGVDLLDLKRASWLRTVAIAGQDVELVEGTILENLQIAREAATLEDMRQACRDAGILDELMANPDGLNARMGAGGLNLSGGQRQRIGLARALLRRPDLLILDEALSAVEPALEARLTDRITEIMRGKTILKVSHRAEDRSTKGNVIRIENGRLVSTSGGAAIPAGGR